MRVFRRRLVGSWADEDGITLVEVLAALMVLAFVMLALSYSLIQGYAALRTTKRIQHATGLGNEAIEAGRDLDYDFLAMVDSDVDPTTDARVLTSCGSLGSGKFFDPDGTGPLNCERLVYSAAGGQVDDHITQQTIDNETYTINRYVTWVDDDSQGGSDQDYKRLVTVIEWTTGSTARTFRASTLVYASPKGLPFIRFELQPTDQTLQAKPGEQITYLHTITNLGIEETFDLSMPNPVGKTWTKAFYLDVDNDGIYDSGSDTLLTDTNGNGTPDTGLMTTDQRVQVLTVFTLSDVEPFGTSTMTLTVTPALEASFAQTATVNLQVLVPELKLYFHNFPSPPTGDTDAIRDLPMETDAPTATTLFNYSQDVYSSPGRMTEEVSGSANESDPDEMANWVWQVPTQITLDGTFQLHLNYEVLPDDKGKCNQGSWDYYVRVKDSAEATNGTTIISDTKNNDKDCGAQWLDETKTIPRITIQPNQWIEVKVMVDKTKGDGAVWNYDTTTYPSYVILPQVVLAPSE